MPHEKFVMRVRIWRHQGASAWYFATLPKRTSMQIRVASGPLRSAWGSIRVAARIGATRWQTSIFPDRRRNAYLLPVKAEVRRREQLVEGRTIMLELELAGPRMRPVPR